MTLLACVAELGLWMKLRCLCPEPHPISGGPPPHHSQEGSFGRPLECSRLILGPPALEFSRQSLLFTVAFQHMHNQNISVGFLVPAFPGNCVRRAVPRRWSLTIDWHSFRFCGWALLGGGDGRCWEPRMLSQGAGSVLSPLTRNV